MRCIVYILILSAVFACSSQGKLQEMEPFQSEKVLVAEKVLMSDAISPCFMMLKGQNLFLIDVKNDSMLYQYSLPDLECIDKVGVKGQAENEFQAFPMFCRTSSDKLYLWGFTPTRIKQFAVTEAGRVSFEADYDLAAYESFNQMHIVEDSLLIYSAIPGEFILKKVNLKSREELGRIILETEEHGEPFFYKNRGIMAANDSLIVYAYTYKKQIDFYRISDMQCCRQLIKSGAPISVTVGDWQHNINYYVNIVAGRRYLYLLCQGEYDEKYLEVFDYSGHSIVKYKFDVVPELFDVDEQNGILYGYNGNFEDYLLKYTLD